MFCACENIYGEFQLDEFFGYGIAVSANIYILAPNSNYIAKLKFAKFNLYFCSK